MDVYCHSNSTSEIEKSPVLINRLTLNVAVYMIFLVSQTFTLTLGPTQPRIRRVPGFFPCGKTAEAWS